MIKENMMSYQDKKTLNLKLNRIENRPTYNINHSITNNNSFLIFIFKSMLLPFKFLFEITSTIYNFITPKLQAYNNEHRKIINKRKSLKRMNSIDQSLNDEIF